MRRAPLLVAMALLAASGCASTKADEASCRRAPADVVARLQSRLTTPGELRNAAMGPPAAGGLTFVSAELHAEGDRDDKKGKILTWASTAAAAADYVAVDVYAREKSSWPPAGFDVRKDGAIASRACAALWVGDHQ